MSNSTLDNLYNSISNPGLSLTLDDRQLPDYLLDSWETFLNTRSLDITTPDVSNQDDNGNFTVSGTTSILRFGSHSVLIRFFTSVDPSNPGNDILESIISIDGSISSYYVSNDYPQLPGYNDYSLERADQGPQRSFLFNMELRSLEFAYCSYDFLSAEREQRSGGTGILGTTLLNSDTYKLTNQAYGAGNNFTGTTQVGNEDYWGLFKTLTDSVSSLELRSYVIQRNDELVISMNQPFTETLSDTIPNLPLTLERVTIESGLEPDSAIGPRFIFNSQLGETEPPLYLQITNGVNQEWMAINGNFGEGEVLTLSGITDLLGLAGLDLSTYLPSGTDESYFGSLGLKEVEFGVNLDPKNVKYLRFTITTQNPWVILEDKLSIEPALTYSITDPYSETQEVELNILGLWMLGGTAFFTNADPLNGLVSVRMGTDQELNVSTVFNQLIPGFPIPDTELIDFAMNADFLNNAYSLQMKAGMGWNFDLGFTSIGMSEAGFSATYNGEEISEGGVAGQFILGNVSFQASAEYSNESGWYLEGGIIPGEVIYLGDFLNQLAVDLGLVETAILPEDIPVDFLQVAVTDFNITYASQSGEFQFFIGLTNVLYISDVLSLDLVETQVQFDANGLSGGYAKIQMTIAGIVFLLQSQKVEGADAWEFHATTQNPIPIGEFIGDLATQFDVDNSIPQAIRDTTLENIQLYYRTDTNDFQFQAQTTLSTDTANYELTLHIDLRRLGDGGYQKTFGGWLKFNEATQFALVFSDDPDEDMFLATYFNGDGTKLDLNSVIASVSSSLADGLPDFQFGIHSALFAWYQPATGDSRYLFGADVEVGINLSNLPLIGQVLPTSETIQLQYQVNVASDVFTKEINKKFNEIMPPLTTPLTVEEDIPAEMTVSTKVQFGEDGTKDLPLDITIGGNGEPAKKSSQQTGENAQEKEESNDGVYWMNLQKDYGPVHFEKVGVKIGSDGLTFYLTSGMTLGGLSLTLDELTMTTPLTEFHPSFGLKGLDIEFKEGELVIAGALLRETAKDENDNDYDIYNGGALISIPDFSLAALGSYAKVNGSPSLFVYGVLDAPLGGWPFLFLEGLAGGFGFNRRLFVPPINQLNTFPLIAVATQQETRGVSQNSLNDMLHQLQEYIPPSVGQYFLTVGIKFSSFKLLDCFALLTVQFGEHFEIDVLGMATAVLPPPEANELGITPIAQVQLALTARFIPDQGFIGVQAQLTDASYILDQDCHLTGGFAFFTWFGPDNVNHQDHTGDFVLTLGGYHPDYNKPAHYPSVPLLGFNWKVTSELTLKGGIYFALTPSLFMAGGTFEATWTSGNIQAWFIANADFLLGWKPYHYQATTFVDVGASYTFKVFGSKQKVSFDVGASLSLWGPDFSGKVHIDYTLVSFTIGFGSSKNKGAKAIPWSDFTSSFLPEDKDKEAQHESQVYYLLGGVSAQAGLSNKDQATPENLGNLNPKLLSLVTNSVVPINKATIGGADQTIPNSAKRFGIAPMNISQSSFESKHEIEILYDQTDRVESKFVITPNYSKMPAALWGTSMEVGLNDEPLVNGLLTGFTIVPKEREDNPAASAAIDQSILEDNPVTYPNVFAYNANTTLIADNQSEMEKKQTINSTITDPTVAEARQEVFEAMGFDYLPLAIDSEVIDDFRSMPQVSTKVSSRAPRSLDTRTVLAKPPRENALPGDLWPWQEVDIEVSGNKAVLFEQQSGEWTYNAKKGMFSADGNVDQKGNGNFLFYGANAGELIGCAFDENDQPAIRFRIGRERVFYVPEGLSGKIRLSMNDQYGEQYGQGSGNNVGQIGIMVTQQDYTFAGFDVDNGIITPHNEFRLTIEVVGAAITYGSRGEPMPVTTAVKVGGTQFTPFGAYNDPVGANVNIDASPHVDELIQTIDQVFPAETPVMVKGTSWRPGNSPRKSLQVNPKNVRNLTILKPFDPIPNTPGFAGQEGVSAFLEPYTVQGRLGIAANQAICLFELGTTNLNSQAADLQDLVLLLTFEGI